MIYETTKDREKETEVIAKFCNKFQTKAHKMSIKYQLDYCITDFRNRVRAFAEVKARNCNLTTYPTIFLSQDKFSRALLFIKHFLTDRLTPIQFLFITRFNDGDFYYKYSEEHALSVEVSGRTVQTRRPDDVEPVVLIPTKYFKEF